MDSDDDQPVVLGEMPIDQDQPTPWADDEPESLPAPVQRWAEEREAVPATVPGTEHGGRPGVLRFDFPGYGGKDLKEISWDDRFKTFDDRHLVFLFQQHMKNGDQSNFFHLDSPTREHD